MATGLFSLFGTSYEDASPVAPGDTPLTLNLIKNWISGLSAGAAPNGPTNRPSIVVSYDQARATGTLADNGLVAADVAGALINGVAATATYATSVNNTLALIKNKINAGGDTPNDLITKSVFATRYFTDASAYFTLNAATGSLSPKVDGTNCTFTATADNAADAAALAAAINAQATAGVKVFAYSDGVDKCYVVAQATPRATITIASGEGTVGCRIGGVLVSVAWATSDAATATALTAAINAAPRVNGLVRAVNSASGVVTVISRTAGDSMPAIGGRGTGLTVGGTTVPQTTLTISSASGTLSAYVDGVLVASITAAGTDTDNAAALAKAINTSSYASRLVTASASAGVVTVTSNDGISLEAVGAGATASDGFLANAGLYGGVAGNAITLASATGVTRSATTLGGGTAGTSGVKISATQAGVSGNWITLAATGAAASHVTASGARLTNGAGSVESAGF